MIFLKLYPILKKVLDPNGIFLRRSHEILHQSILFPVWCKYRLWMKVCPWNCCFIMLTSSSLFSVISSIILKYKACLLLRCWLSFLYALYPGQLLVFFFFFFFFVWFDTAIFEASFGLWWNFFGVHFYVENDSNTEYTEKETCQSDV